MMRNRLSELYAYAEAEGIDVDNYPIGVSKAFAVLLPRGKRCIAIDDRKINTTAEKTVCLAHELGHCETGSFYDCWVSYDLRAKLEYRANKWAVEFLLPESDLIEAVSSGYSEPWEMAEYFDLPESFIQTAIEHYRIIRGELTN